MANLNARFGIFKDTYDVRQQRAFIAELERQLARVAVDVSSPQTAVAGGATYDVTGFDNLLLCDTSTGNITVNLPLPDGTLVSAKFEVNVKKEASGNTLYIAPTGGAVTDFGTDTIVISNKGTSLCFRAAPDGWRII